MPEFHRHPQIGMMLLENAMPTPRFAPVRA
jgi:hypothetical protein